MHATMKTILALLLTTTLSATAAVFQYTVPVATAKNPSVAFLWLPADAPKIRGVIIAGMALMEREMAKDAVIRQACAEQGLAIFFLKVGLGGADLQKALADLAQVSGYAELATAPLLFVGHSASGPQAHDLAVKFADRCFGLVQYRGGGPWHGGTPIAANIPSLMMVGQYDEFGGAMRDENGREHAWEGSCDGMASYRATNEARLASIVVEPGAGHFAWSDRNAAYLALFLKKAGAVIGKTIDHKTGWLTDLNLRTPGACAAYATYKGDKTKTSWHFDAELAQATVAYHVGLAGKKDQFIKWNDGYWVDAGTRYFFTGLKWVGDGQTFEVHPQYTDKPPAQQNGPRWPVPAEPLGHSTAPILIKQVSGPVVATATTTFRIQFDNLAPATEGMGRVTFMAYSLGDNVYRYTEQVGMMPRGFGGLNAGKEQAITFPEIGNLKVSSAPVELKATSDVGLPVEYYVAYGPATIVAGKLKLAEIPSRATFPIEVKVVAYQIGSGVEPKVKGAKPVEQTIKIEKP
jgi:hypothetical protein